MGKICGTRVCFALICFTGWCAVAFGRAPPEDAEPGSIDWQQVPTRERNFYLGDDGYAYVQINPAYIASQSLIGSHACTMLGMNLPHRHFQYDFPVGNATVSRVNAFWDAWFLWKDPQNTIQPQIGGMPPTTQSNCYTYAMREVFKGVYGYWLTTESFNTALSHDMYYAGYIADAYSPVCLKDNSIINYGGHASFISSVEEPPDNGCDPPTDCGAIRSIRWKWRESAIYGRSMDSAYTILADTATFHFLILPGQHAETVRQNTGWGSYVYSTCGGDVWHKTR